MTPKQLKDTEATQRFMNQIDIDDRPAVLQLIESLILIDHNTFEQGLVRQLAQLHATVGTSRSLAFFAVRETRKSNHASMTDLLGPGGYVDPNVLRSHSDRRPSYFDRKSRSIRPNAVGTGAGVGSEGNVARLIRNMCNPMPHRLHDHPSVVSLKATKCRDLVLVDDFIGSGTRVCSFVDSFMNHPTIRSWRSYGKLVVHVAAYAATMKGLKAVQAHRNVDKIHYTLLLDEGSRAWQPTEREAIRAICRRYGHRMGRSDAAYGYKDIFSMIVFEHKCPNTAPVMLWGKTGNWDPLFQEQPQQGLPAWPVLDEAAEADRLNRVLKALGQKALSTSDWQTYVSHEGRNRFMVLAAIARGFRKPQSISRYATLSVPTCTTLMNECVTFGWATDSFSPTTAGLRELEHTRRLGLSDEPLRVALPVKSEYYFPKSLRHQGSI